MKKNFTFYLESETVEKLRKKAKEQNRSLNNYIETLIEKDVIEHFTKPGDLIFEPFTGSGTIILATSKKEKK